MFDERLKGRKNNKSVEKRSLWFSHTNALFSDLEMQAYCVIMSHYYLNSTGAISK